jgi:hypothetical protein
MWTLSHAPPSAGEWSQDATGSLPAAKVKLPPATSALAPCSSARANSPAILFVISSPYPRTETRMKSILLRLSVGVSIGPVVLNAHHQRCEPAANDLRIVTELNGWLASAEWCG